MDPEAANQLRILLVDDHAVMRQGLARLLSEEEDLAVCGEAENFEQALAAVESLNPDLVVADISLKGRDGIELIKELLLRNPARQILALSMHDEFMYAERALRAGARGYIMKEEAAEQVLAAIRQIMSGAIYVSPRMSAHIMQNMTARRVAPPGPALGELSDREIQVFRFIGQGLSTRQIAAELNLSVKTVETYREHIKRKLNLKTGGELLRLAVQRSLRGE